MTLTGSNVKVNWPLFVSIV